MIEIVIFKNFVWSLIGEDDGLENISKLSNFILIMVDWIVDSFGNYSYIKCL